jgi:hypothetical protein
MTQTGELIVTDYETAAISAGWYLDKRINKWRCAGSSALYCNTERWARYACEDHNLTTPDDSPAAAAAHFEQLATELENSQ